MEGLPRHPAAARGVTPPLDVERAQILAFRRRVGALDERLPSGPDSLRARRGPACRTACRAPRCCRSTPASTARAVHLGGPGARPAVGTAVQRVRRRGAGPRGSRSAGCRTAPAGGVAEDLADRLDAVLDGRRLPYGEAGARSACTTTAALRRHDRHGSSSAGTAPGSRPSGRCRRRRSTRLEARLELARRYLHVLGPGPSRVSPAGPGSAARAAGPAFEALAPELTPVRDADRRRLDPRARRADLPRRPGPAAPARLLPSGDRSACSGAATASSWCRTPAPRRAVDVPRLAGRRPGRRRGRRHLAPRGGEGHHRRGAARAAARERWNARRRHCRCPPSERPGWSSGGTTRVSDRCAACDGPAWRCSPWPSSSWPGSRAVSDSRPPSCCRTCSTPARNP